MPNLTPHQPLTALANQLYTRLLPAPHPPISNLEAHLASFYLAHSREPTLSPLPVLPILFEALFCLARADTTHRPRFLTILLILATTSPQAWHLLHASHALDEMHQLGSISVQLLLGNWDCANHALRDAIAQAMKQLCVNCDIEDSPVAMALRYTLQKGEVVDGEENRDAVGRALGIVGVEGLGAVRDEEWVEVVRMLGLRGWAMAVVRQRTAVVTARGDGSIVVARMKAVLEEMGVAEMHQVGEKVGVDDEGVVVGGLEGELIGVFDRVRREAAGGVTGIILSMVREWVEKGDLRRAAAAYLAAPQVVGRVVERVKGMDEVVEGMSWQLWSVVDDEIDGSLRELVCGVEEIAVVLGQRCMDNGDRSRMRLKRVALMHPWILRRRTKSVEGVVHTVLHGLIDGMGKYGPGGIKVLEVCVEIIGMIEGDLYGSVSRDILRFMMGEGRDVNGVPDMFGDLAVALFRLLARGPVGKETSELIQLVIRGKGTSDRIRQAAEGLLAR